ncbi:MAG: glycoside-pentoside-hexuronide (GPH):cation symporter [Propionicimonas sp.]|uniref:MFS transporter n=1 Tax=Propionicimonas sp. TaxID=1955623 RepID=UPI002B21ECF6|nr:glycoside-pentoside-hexuronide (GPH):cation symporter [Propionicimonas sp.]MEA4945682.1 glycoside-pentoside-hexuronide (GPH):cation symporter [Propionicimonas sp.]MEA5118678.1 glycoside-pentoside-hexuronide (GPH):cation symporter [Propionicimonas sp.]
MSRDTSVSMPKASIWRKLGYAIGEIGYNGMWYVVSAFLLVFYTDVFLIPAATVSTFVLIIRLADAIVDPIAGSIADRTRTRFGRYRPYLIAGPLAMIITLTLTFWAHPDWAMPGKIAYAIVTFALAAIASTFTNMPYGALNAVLTLDTDERLSFASWRFVMVSVGNALIGLAVVPLLEFFSKGPGGAVQGYVMTVPTVGIVAFIIFVICFLSTREVVQPKAGVAAPKMKDLWRSVLHNRPLQIVVLGFFLFGFLAYGRIAVMAYFFQYNIGDLGQFGPFNLVINMTGLVGSLLAPVLLKWIPSGNKARVVIIACLWQVGWYVASYFVAAADTMGWFFVFSGLAGLGYGVLLTMIYGMVPDTVEYGEVKSGIRSEGFNYAFTSLAMKWGGAAGPAVLGFLLAAYGYLPNAQQNEGVLAVIALSLTILPAVLTLIVAIPFFWYRIDRNSHHEMVSQLLESGSLEHS